MLEGGGGGAMLSFVLLPPSPPPLAYTPLLGPILLLSPQAQSLPLRGAAVLFFLGGGHIRCVLGGFWFWGEGRGCMFLLGYV